jgi:hypothetical protein
MERGMARDRNTDNRGKASPDERYREFAEQNAAWDSRVKKSIAKIEKASRARETRQATGS